MIDGIHIREYKPGDKPSLLRILKLNVPAYFAESEIDDLDNYLENKIEKYFVVELDNEIIGSGGINFENNNTIAKISWDFLDPFFQGKGIGQKLLRFRIDHLRTLRNVERISVRTSQFAYKFYEKSGFVLKEVVKDYWAEGFDLYNMTLE